MQSEYVAIFMPTPTRVRFDTRLARGFEMAPPPSGLQVRRIWDSREVVGREVLKGRADTLGFRSLWALPFNLRQFLHPQWQNYAQA
jgi:hypothetical protein